MARIIDVFPKEKVIKSMNTSLSFLFADMLTFLKGLRVAKKLAYNESMGLNITAVYGLTTRANDGLSFYDFCRFSHYSKFESRMRVMRYLVEVECFYKQLIKQHNIQLDVYLFSRAFLNCNFELKNLADVEDATSTLRGRISAVDFAGLLVSGLSYDKAVKLYSVGCEVEDFEGMKNVPIEWAHSLVRK